MKMRSRKVNSVVMAGCAFAAVLSFARESRAYWFTSEEASRSGPTGFNAGQVGAACYSSDGDICTSGDTVRYMVSALNLEDPIVNVTPYNPESWVVTGNDMAWCYASVACHLAGDQQYVTDEHVWVPGDEAPVACHVDCGSGVADDIYVNVGVGIYPP